MWHTQTQTEKADTQRHTHSDWEHREDSARRQIRKADTQRPDTVHTEADTAHTRGRHRPHKRTTPHRKTNAKAQGGNRHTQAHTDTQRGRTDRHTEQKHAEMHQHRAHRVEGTKREKLQTKPHTGRGAPHRSESHRGIHIT